MALDICLRRLDDCGLVDARQTAEKVRNFATLANALKMIIFT